MHGGNERYITVLVGKHEGKRLVGKLKRRLKDCIKIEL
jgi:hypothetical protein